MNILEYENYQEKKIHVDVDFPYNTYICSIPLDFTHVPAHWHEEMEIIYIKKGQGYVTIDFQQYMVTENTLVLILPGQIHSIESYEEYGKKFSMEYENIIFQISMLFSQKEDTSISNFFRPLLNGQITLPTLYSPLSNHYESLSACINACDEICKTKPDGYELFIKAKLFEFFYILNAHYKTEDTIKTIKSFDKIREIMKYVENHYQEKITIKDMAELVEFSESHFMRYFKDSLGISFTNYLRDYRLTMASRLLAVSDASILNISESVGFDNLSYFNRAFKKYYGMTPSQYRKMM